ncbi:QacE family quaternary ammonium compound efflux SMR transporter [Helicobacter aurati]|uniref:Guanidinium exporter n=1 Tax=Helicobacter aurati TaxID=137778 RepID=A0A3D8IYY4_9HELI|nr:SMR family transporter [Helicobacter aurati]RDU69834.1 QacE family quaternary ammonium compound efflux SMR transporter [Helicobacter aurati]
MSWVFLILAGCAEILGIIAMKQLLTTGKKIFILALALIFMLSFGLLSLAMQEISMATAYAIWTGIGAGGGVIVGIVFFKEDKSFLKLFFLLLIILSSIGLKALS